MVEIGGSSMPEVYDQNYWDNKWPKAPIVYRGRSLMKSKKPVGIDVKDFITPNDNMILDVVKRFGLKKPTFNETALTVQRWVVKFLSYKYDDDSSDCEEFWMFPFETLQGQIGDCEDGAILIATLCMAAGIPSWRIKVAAGDVQEAPTAPTGGHAYCIYLADRPDSERKLDWVILDWCFYEDSTWPIEKKQLARDGGYKGYYKATWFTFNNENSWNQTALSIGAGRISEDQTKVFEEAVQEEKDFIESVMSSIESKVGEWQL
jgi:hypothetical protein